MRVPANSCWLAATKSRTPRRRSLRPATSLRHRHPHGGASIQFLEVRHRAHARVEDRIRCGKNTGFGRFPSRQFAINAAWLELALTGIDLLAWTQALLLDGDLAAAEPKKLRYRLLHVAARITRTARRTRLRIAAGLALGRRPRPRVRPPARLPQPVT